MHFPSPYVDLRRCARALTLNLGAATHTSCSLYNNSSASDYLLVWMLIGSINGTPGYSISYQQIAPLSTVVGTQPIVPTEAPPPGLASTGDQATQYSLNWALDTHFNGPYWPATFPFAVLPPGWCLMAQNASVPTGSMEVCWWWEAISANIFRRLYTHDYLDTDPDLLA